MSSLVVQASSAIARILVLALVLSAGTVCAETPDVSSEAYSADIQESVARLKKGMAERSTPQNNVVSAALAHEQKQAKETTISPFRVFQALALCIGVFLVYVALAKKLNSKKNGPLSSDMKVVKRMALTSKTSLLLVEVEGRRILAAVGSERVQLTHLEGDYALPLTTEEVCEEPIRLSA